MQKLQRSKEEPKDLEFSILQSRGEFELSRMGVLVDQYDSFEECLSKIISLGGKSVSFQREFSDGRK